MSTSVFWTETMIELPEVREGGMSGRNEQRKPGTTRGSPRRSRTAKASRISRYAVKSRCAHEWGGWGRLSDDGPGHYNPDLSGGFWLIHCCSFPIYDAPEMVPLRPPLGDKNETRADRHHHDAQENDAFCWPAYMAP